MFCITYEFFVKPFSFGSSSGMLTGEQVRAARVLLGWTRAKLAETAALGLATVQRIEAQSGQVHGMLDTVLKLKNALEAAGIIFIEEDEMAGVGVRLAKSKPSKGRKRRM
jgi:transcriptional regulator with XRE-family HTH domain